MNLKEVSELRRRFRMDRNAISRIYGCFVNSSREIVSYIDESMGILPQDEAEKYLNLLKKALSGKLGKNLIDIIFSTEQVADSDEHRLLMALRDSQLKDGDIREEFYQKIINSLDLGDSNYLILLAHDTYDVPHKNKNDEMDADASDAVFSYVVCCVCPVKERKAELGFFPGDNEFHSCVGQIVAAPELGFVFPAFDDRAANIYNALFYSRKADEIHQEVIDSVFHTTAPMSAAEQKEAFQNALSEALGDACNMELVQSIHDRLRDQIEQYKESHDPEPLELSVSDAAEILRDNGVEEEKILAFRDNCFAQFGDGATLNPANLIDSSRFEVKTADATISLDPEHSYCVEGNLQAVLDEYAFTLGGGSDLELLRQMKSGFVDTASIQIETWESFLGHREKSRLRTHFAVGYFNAQVNEKTMQRTENIRSAFNSPFRPFVLATTSIGQEGLDFHNYCRKIMHWNLPSNPIDLEQREGRINRYLCHAIRQNLADSEFGAFPFEKSVWKETMDRATVALKQNHSDLIPYWCLPDDFPFKYKIERIVPMYPYSQDRCRYDHLMDVLSVYRLTLGQPRQEELFETIHKENWNMDELKKLYINLSPWNRAHHIGGTEHED